MPNRDAPNGLTPTRHLTGGVIRTNEYRIADAYATDLYRGQLVDLGTTGKEIIAATDDGDAIGVFGGVSYVDANGDTQFRGRWTASTTVLSGSTIRAVVFDDPSILFRIQGDAAVDAIDIGAFAGMTAIGTGDNSLERSISELNSGDITANEDSLYIYMLFEAPDNDYGANAEVEVLLGNHLLGSVISAS